MSGLFRALSKCVSVKKIALHFRFVYLIIVFAGLGKVGKTGQGLKRDVCRYEENACVLSSLDQVHVSET